MGAITRHRDDTEPSFSRRGFLAGLAVMAGLGLLGAKDAFGYSYYGENAGVGHGAWDAWGMLNGLACRPSGLSNPVNKCMGYATDWDKWNALSGGGQQLRYALNFQVECDWENELYVRLSVYPLTNCGDINNKNTSRLWYAGGDDNLGQVFMDGGDQSILDYSGDLLNTGLGAGMGGWHDSGWYHYQYGSALIWLRKRIWETPASFRSKLKVKRIWEEGTWYEDFRRSIETDWISTKVPEIGIACRGDIVGRIVRFRLASNEDTVLAGGWYGRATEGTRLAPGKSPKGKPECDLTSLFLIDRTEWPSHVDEIGPDRSGRVVLRAAWIPGQNAQIGTNGGPNDSRRPADNENLDVAVNYLDNPFLRYENTLGCRRSMWWPVERKADGSLYADGYTVLINDGSGHPIRRGSGSDFITGHDGYIDHAASYRDSYFTVEEVPVSGSISLKCKEVSYPDPVELNDPANSLLPNLTGGKSGLNGAWKQVFRWYASDEGSKVAIGDIRVWGGCWIDYTGSPQAETAFGDRDAYTGLGSLTGFFALTMIKLELKDSPWGGSICYSIVDVNGSESETRRDGGRAKTGARIAGLKVWLEGEVSDHVDLRVSVFNINDGWSRCDLHSADKDDPYVMGSTYANWAKCVQVDLIGKPKAAILLHDFDGGKEILEPDEELSSQIDGKYVSCVAGLQAVGRRWGTDIGCLVDRFHGYVYSEPAIYRFRKVTVRYYTDGIDDESIVFEDHVDAGHYNVNEAAIYAALKERCNLDDHFDEPSSTGFAGWFADKALTRPFTGAELVMGQEISIYGRNRCTLRVDYADGSLKPEEGVVYVSKPKDGASPVEGALELPDFSDLAESHRLDGIGLPAIGDNGAGHMAAYYGERISFAAPASVYRKMGDGTWRHIVCDAYLTDKAGGGRPCEASKWCGTPRSTSGGATPIRTASPAQRNRYQSGRRCGLRPEPARVPFGRCA